MDRQTRCRVIEEGMRAFTEQDTHNPYESNEPEHELWAQAFYGAYVTAMTLLLESGDNPMQSMN